MPILSLWIAALMLSASGCSTKRVKVETPPPINAQCEAKCFEKCPALPPWTSGEYPELEQLAAKDGEIIADCESRRQACASCLDRLKKKGIIQ
jgi:hypothetical protein